jgi:hypothetical protein
MITIRSFLVSIFLPVFLVSLGYADDLSSYRTFHLGMDLPAVARQTGIDLSEARPICLRPALIQELEWTPQRSSASSSPTDPVSVVLFEFYNGELFRILVSYDQGRIEGLTDEDIIERISAKYGTPKRPIATVSIFSSSHLYSRDEKVITRWEDSQYSLNFLRLSYPSTAGMLIFSKRLDPLAHTAMVEAARLDAQEAPQREIDRQKKQNQEKREAGEKARPVNKENFQP